MFNLLFSSPKPNYGPHEAGRNSTPSRHTATLPYRLSGYCPYTIFAIFPGLRKRKRYQMQEKAADSPFFCLM